MQHPARHLLLGAFAAAVLTALTAGAWLALAPHEARPAEDIATAEEVLPLPPEPPRLADGPEMQRCMELLRTDPEEARSFALTWGIATPNDGARHCEALAILALGDPARAAERLEMLAGRASAGAAARAAVFAQAGQAWMMAGNALRAYGTTTMALALSPDDADLLIDRAVALGSLGRYGEAVADLDHAVRLDESRPEALVFRAAARRHLDQADQARRDVEIALALAPDNVEALLERGILRQLAGDTEGARMDWERILDMAPTSAAADLAAQNLALSDAGPFRR